MMSFTGTVFIMSLPFSLVYALRAYGLVGYDAWVAIVLSFFTLFAAYAQWLTGTGQSPMVILACGAMFVQGIGGGN
jgi:exosortase/archaeosortase